MRTIGLPGYPWAPHEILWAEATLCLSPAERKSAFYDIAEMTGRTVAAVEDRAYGIAATMRRAA